MRPLLLTCIISIAILSQSFIESKFTSVESFSSEFFETRTLIFFQGSNEVVRLKQVGSRMDFGYVSKSTIISFFETRWWYSVLDQAGMLANVFP